MKPLSIFLTLFVVGVTAINPTASGLELNDKFLEVKDDGMWFVEFYAPWCAHCKRLHPVWNQVGHALEDMNVPVRVAKLDCTRFPTVANSLDIAGYPTIAFFRNGKRIDFRGTRDKETLVNFAVKCASPIVKSIDESQISKINLESRSDPSFIIYGKEDADMFEKFTEVAEGLFSTTRFYIVEKSDSSQSTDKVIVVKDNTVTSYKGNADDLEQWIMRERWPSFIAASSANLADIGSSGKLVVVIVSNKIKRFNDSTSVGVFHSTAQGAVELVKSDKKLWDTFQFVWLDGSDLASVIQMQNVDEPSIFVFNYTSYEYYLSNDDVDKMTSRSIVTFLKELAKSIEKGTAQPQGGRGISTRLQRMAFETYWNVAQMFATQPLLSSCLFGVPIAFLSIICYSICSADFTVDRDEFYPEDEDEFLDEAGTDDENAEIDSDHEKAD